MTGFSGVQVTTLNDLARPEKGSGGRSQRDGRQRVRAEAGVGVRWKNAGFGPRHTWIDTSRGPRGPRSEITVRATEIATHTVRDI